MWWEKVSEILKLSISWKQPCDVPAMCLCLLQTQNCNPLRPFPARWHHSFIATDYCCIHCMQSRHYSQRRFLLGLLLESEQKPFLCRFQLMASISGSFEFTLFCLFMTYINQVTSDKKRNCFIKFVPKHLLSDRWKTQFQFRAYFNYTLEASEDLKAAGVNIIKSRDFFIIAGSPEVS